MTSRVILEPKTLGEQVLVPFDFTSRLAASETISTKVVTCTTWSGTDASPSSMISGAASSSGATVSQLVIGGVAGVTYYLLCSITTSLGQTLQLAGFLVVLPTPVL
jgi:hypothetical protein